MKKPIFVIVGAGQAGAMAAAELRQNGFAGRIVLIGDEPHAPYERPPLSKDVLLQPENTRCQLFADGFYDEQNIEIKLGAPVSAIDPDARTVVLSSGETLSFDKLLLATGAQVRRLPLLDQLGGDVYTLRTLDDARKLRSVLQPGRRIVLVGGGVIGLELASSAADLGAKVTVIEQAPMVMGRCSPRILTEFLCDVHRKRGVVLHLGTPVTQARRENGEIVVTLQDGTLVVGDAVIYGIGIDPDTRLASSAGLNVDDGILIDENCATSHPGIYAAGDAARQWDGANRQYHRRETWENAKNQAIAAARAMMEVEPIKADVPWFWTSQCGANIQFAGDMAAEEWIVRGQMDESRFMLFGLKDGELVGAITVNQGRNMRSARMLIAKRARLALDIWQDPQKNLRSLLNSA